ncbi:MAG: phosphoribosylamine--glycine ligase [Actinomycetota bacterium]|nr:phosphoribosylamine--glycine ligase [Actinomycetota bacterium]
MKVLLLGSGGRESALAAALARSVSVDGLWAMPGNPGIECVAELLSGDPNDPEGVVDMARRIAADLVVVGPEAPLVAGVTDAASQLGIAVFGPSQAAAKIEGSKSHAKSLMTRSGIPTAGAVTCTDLDDAVRAIDRFGPPYVVKADGLAAGKGVVVTTDRAEAMDALDERLTRGVFGEAGRTVVIEEFLDGQELSLIAFCDGKTALVCEPAQDYKRAFDGDVGPNTGGMGSYSPVPACPPEMTESIVYEVIEPMVAALSESGAPFVGALYAGLALTSRGPRVVEFNARFGDPETQALIPRLKSDFAELCMAAATGSLAGMTLEWDPRCCVSVVLASGGYPASYRTGVEISGIDRAAGVDGVSVFHAGTTRVDGSLATSGGRVLAVSALGETFDDARRCAYRAADMIEFEGKHIRRDIAERAVRAETGASA